MDVEIKDLEKVSVDKTKLESNIGDIVSDCQGIEGFDLASELNNRFPLVTRLLRTAASNEVRRRRINRMRYMHKGTVDDEEKWLLEVPGMIWSEPPVSTAEECCWVPFDFAKCAGNVPINLLCLKDCQNVLDSFIYDDLRFGQGESIQGIANTGESLATVNKRIDRMSMAFLTAQNVILGTDDTYTDTLKPFHGLIQVLSNPAVANYDGTNVLSAFDQIGCRLAMLGGSQFFATNPIVYRTLEKLVVPDINGRYPGDWTKRNGRLQFMGREFIEDKIVPVDTSASTGEVWVLDDETVGLFLATDLAPTDKYIKTSGLQTEEAPTCGSECTYMYNYGAAFGTNANTIATITDIPIYSACTDTIADLGSLVNPNTLVPKPGSVA